MSDHPVAGTGAVEHQILVIVRAVLSGPLIAADDELAVHGATSLSIVRIIAEVSRDLGRDIDPREVGDRITARSMAEVARPTASDVAP